LPVIRANRLQFIELVSNLIGNAIKYRGDEESRIHIGAKIEDSNVIFFVRDNGIGIDPKHASRIFQIFQRLHGRDKYGGTGIGLAIAKKIVERHGGHIWVESTPGNGATFFFAIPLNAPRTEPPSAAKLPPSATSAP
jgi:light-regulated signal transduction histidine kinase (bacteriophytochrome)